MIAILLLALFTAVGSVLVIADGAVRGRHAFRQLHGTSRERAVQLPVSIRFEDLGARSGVPAPRQRNAATARLARHPVRWPVPSLRAAA